MKWKIKKSHFWIFVLTMLFCGLGAKIQKVEAASIANGYYVIKSGLNNQKVLEVKDGNKVDKAGIQIRTYAGTPQSIFKVTYIKGGYYKIAAVHSGKVLDVAGASKRSEATLQQYKWNGSSAQLWKFVSAGNGHYYIRSKLGTCIDVASAATGDGSKVWMYASNKTNAQKWKLSKISRHLYPATQSLNLSKNGGTSNVSVFSIGSWKVSSNKSWIKVKKTSSLIRITCSSNSGDERSGNITIKNGNISKKIKVTQAGNFSRISNGTYELCTALDENMVLDVSEASIADGANIQIWSRANVNQQKFEITQVFGDYYKIRAVHSGKYLDVTGGSSASGTNVQQYPYNGSTAQLWRFISADSGYYYIQSKAGTYMDVASGIAQNGTNVWMYSLNKTAAQKWKLKATTPVTPQFNINDAKVFQKQKTSYTCTLAAAATMMRRKSIILGNQNWDIFNEAGYGNTNDFEATVWMDGVGLRGGFSYGGITVTSMNISSRSKSDFVNWLSYHPEGIVIYDKDIPHAILLTDYDPTTDTFYCADSDTNPRIPLGRIPLQSSSFGVVRYPGQSVERILQKMDKIWYVQ